MPRPTAIALILCLASPAVADGFNPALADPEVIAPAQTWTGPYAGLSYSQSETTAETVRCFKLGQPRACDDPIFETYPDYKVAVRSSVTETDSRVGALVGYRWDLGRVVPGVEASSVSGLGVNLGLDLGDLLPYAHYDRAGAALGIEARLSRHLRAGVRAGNGTAALTIGWGW